MNRAEMRLRVRHNISELVYDDPADPDYDPDLSGNFWKDSFINNALDDGIKKFSREERWDWLWRTVTGIAIPAGTANIDLQSGVEIGRHAYLSINDGQRSYLLKKVSTGEGLRLRHSRFDTPAQPQAWFPSHASVDTKVTTINIVPVPSIAYTGELHYIANPRTLDEDTDSPDIPEVYQPAIVAWATMVCWVKEKDSGKAAESLAIYESILEDARNELNRQGAGESLTWGRPDFHRRPTDRDWYARHIPGSLG